MEDPDFDRALVTSAFALIAESGWRTLTVAAAARAAGLPLDRARARFPGRHAILLRFGRLADQAALAGPTEDSTPRDRLLGLVMARIDVLQAHRPGMLALLHDLPRDPTTALLLTLATLRSLRWLLDAAGISTAGLRGRLRVKAMLAVWLYTIRAWAADEGEDLSATLAALDRALTRAEQAETSLGSP